MNTGPNVLLILNDDMGYSDIGCYGGEIRTPSLDRLAAGGVRFTQFYSSPRCSPSRASLLTGLHPHQTGIGILTECLGPESYPGDLNRKCVTMAELLGENGYSTYMSGKWHVAHDLQATGNWPCDRGFERFYGTICGAGNYFYPTTLTRQSENVEHEARDNRNYYYTDAISDNAVAFIEEHVRNRPDKPFFQYVAFTAPHWPLHAPAEDIARYKGRFDAGWDRLREERLDRMREMGVVDASWQLTDRDPSQPPWENAEHKEWQARRMEVYAAQVDRMDQGIGRIVGALERTGQLDNTLIMFLADNGGCAEEISGTAWDHATKDGDIYRVRTRGGKRVRFKNDPALMPGGEGTYQSYGIPWANLSNTPFRMYKHWTHEGGIATPFILHWPNGTGNHGVSRHSPCQLTDVMATVIEVTGAEYPAEYKENEILPLEGTTLTPIFDRDNPDRGPLFWEHEGNAAVREGRWKLVKKYQGDWELFDMVEDRTEMNDLATVHPDKVERMRDVYEKWADRCGVIPREVVLKAGDKRK